MTKSKRRQLLSGRLVLTFNDQLAAGRRDVLSPALPHRDDQTMIGKYSRELVDDLV